MANKKVTRRALGMSVVALILCCAMLVGTTFARFTDTESSAVNTIQSGNLDVDLVDAQGNSVVGKSLNFKNVKGETDILWEPGCTFKLDPVYVKNNGNLALKYEIAITGINGNAKLLEVIDWEIIDTNATSAGGNLLADATSEAIVIEAHMQEEAGNEYQGLTLSGIGITVVATQDTVEFDSYDNQYDKDAVLPTIVSGAEYPVHNADNNSVMGSAVVPTNALVDPEVVPEFKADPIELPADVPVPAGYTAVAFNITANNIRSDNQLPIKMELKIQTGLDPDYVKIYHYNEEIPCTYNPNTGSVVFETATFSPFTVAFDESKVYVPSEPDQSDLPKADVVNSIEYENVELPWGSYGQWSPTEGLDAQLEAAYTFSCTETLDEAKANPYATWYCDFYVKLDRDLGANQIFLGGNYGSFGWVGFHNGDVTLTANEELPLLGSVTGNPWTYQDVVQNVGTFICGVGDVDNALSGATFTVMLRLTNPEDETEFYNVATINYTFE